MAKKRKNSTPVQQKKSKSRFFVGTIDCNEILINREGKVNLGSNPEIRSHIHKSVKDYDRSRSKKEVKAYLRDECF